MSLEKYNFRYLYLIYFNDLREGTGLCYIFITINIYNFRCLYLIF